MENNKKKKLWKSAGVQIDTKIGKSTVFATEVLKVYGRFFIKRKTSIRFQLYIIDKEGIGDSNTKNRLKKHQIEPKQ